MKNWKQFLKKIKKLKFYIIKFNENSIIKNKKYFLNCIIDRKVWLLIVIIIFDKYIFFVNNNIYKI